MRELNIYQVNSEELQQEVLKVLKDQLTMLSENLHSKATEEYLTREDVAKICKVTKSTVSNWKNEGVLNAYGLGGRVYYKRSEIGSSMIKIN